MAVLPNPGVPARFDVSARALSDSPELSLSNNTASTRISVPSTPAATAIKRALQPAETTQQPTRRPLPAVR
jgi:hypothetical protein